MDYRTLSEEKKVEHLEAYSAALHQVKNRCQVLVIQGHIKDRTIAELQARVAELERVNVPCLKAS